MTRIGFSEEQKITTAKSIILYLYFICAVILYGKFIFPELLLVSLIFAGDTVKGITAWAGNDGEYTWGIVVEEYSAEQHYENWKCTLGIQQLDSNNNISFVNF